MTIGAYTPGLPLPCLNHEWNGEVECLQCASARQKLTYPPQPQLASAIQDTLKEVGRKYFSGDKASQEAGDGGNSGGYSYKEIADLASDLALPATNTPLLSAPFRVLDCYGDCVAHGRDFGKLKSLAKHLTNERCSDHRIVDQLGRLVYVNAVRSGSGYTAIRQTFPTTGAIFKEEQNAYFDRIKAEARQARMERRAPFDVAAFYTESREREKRENATDALAKAMQQPSQTDLALNDQILSARYGRG